MASKSVVVIIGESGRSRHEGPLKARLGSARLGPARPQTLIRFDGFEPAVVI